MLTSLRARDLLAVEPAFARLRVPTLIVWGTGHKFIRLKWAYWLRDTIPGATDVVEIESAIAGGGNLAAIVDDLIDRAITHGGRDNVSVVVAEVAA